MGQLTKVSTVGVLCVPLLFICVIVRTPNYSNWHPVTVVGNDVFSAFGVMAFAFVSNQIAFLNYMTLRGRGIIPWSKAVIIGISTSWVISMTFAVIGFVTFGSNVSENVVLSYGKDDALINFARIVVSFSLMLTYPMQVGFT